jgi:DNA-binding transcriptional ArsR family regulator
MPARTGWGLRDRDSGIGSPGGPARMDVPDRPRSTPRPVGQPLQDLAGQRPVEQDAGALAAEHDLGGARRGQKPPGTVPGKVLRQQIPVLPDRNDLLHPHPARHIQDLIGRLDICRYWNMMRGVARASTTSDVFNAVADVHRREILDALITGEKPVGAIVNDLSMSQPQVSKHLRVLSEVGLVSRRADGRRRLYRLEPARLRPMHEWLARYEQAWNDRLDRLDDYLADLQRREQAQ